jgi:hypothetical protein
LTETGNGEEKKMSSRRSFESFSAGDTGLPDGWRYLRAIAFRAVASAGIVQT